MLLTVGRILRPHGIRGEVVVEVRTDEPRQRYAVGAVLAAAPAGPGQAEPGQARAGEAEPGRQVGPERLIVDMARPHQGKLIVAFRGVADRTAADQLRGLVLQVDSEDVDRTGDPDEFHDHELVGLAAVDPAGEALGEVTGVDHAPAADLLVVRRPGGRTALVPFVGAIVPEVDLAGGRIVIDPPPGLLDL